MIISDYLRKIEPYLTNNKYIFRGVSNSNFLNETGAFRRIEKSDLISGGVYQSEEELSKVLSREHNENKSFVLRTSFKGTHIQLAQNLIEDFQEYNINLIAQARKQGYGEKNLKDLSDLQTLAELQHFGAATCLLDFTRSFLTALWFAVEGNPNADGKVYVIDEENLNKANSKNNIKEFLNNTAIYFWTPQTINSRIVAQDSCFVFGPPILNDEEKIKEITINKSDKRLIEYELNKFFNINSAVLFPDLQGFSLANSTSRSIGMTNFNLIIESLILNEKWDDLQSNISICNVRQLEMIVKALFKNKIKINEDTLKSSHTLLLESPENLSTSYYFKDLLGVINYNNIDSFTTNIHSLRGDYATPEDCFIGFSHTSIYEYVEEEKQNQSGILLYDKRDLLFWIASSFMQEEDRKDQKTLEEALLNNPNFNDSLKKEYKNFVADGKIRLDFKMSLSS